MSTQYRASIFYGVAVPDSFEGDPEELAVDHGLEAVQIGNAWRGDQQWYIKAPHYGATAFDNFGALAVDVRNPPLSIKAKITLLDFGSPEWHLGLCCL